MTNGNFCSSCGAPIAPQAAATVLAETRRQRKELRLIAAVLGVLIAFSAGLVVFHLRRPSSAAIPARQQSSPANSPGQDSSLSAPQDSVPATSSSSEVSPGNFENSSGSSPQAPSSDTSQPQRPQISQQSTQPPFDVSAGSDQYPGSQAIDVDKSKMPDVGFPVATETYTTTDSVDTVIEYYKRRYPGTQVSQMQGQNVIAVERNGKAKVIAIGSNGSETRIAIVQPQ